MRGRLVWGIAAFCSIVLATGSHCQTLSDEGHSIWVDKSRQRAYAFEGHRLWFEAVCSTAAHYRHWAPGEDRWELPSTPLGSYRIYSKQVDHYSRLFEVHMRYALFYDGGRAIHATYRSEYGKLGRPASGGCVRLTLSRAIELFEWAHVGDPVHIVWQVPADLAPSLEAERPRPVVVLTRPQSPARLSTLPIRARLEPAPEITPGTLATMPDEVIEPPSLPSGGPSP